MDYRKHFDELCKEYKLCSKMSTEMPAGYENAFGTFDTVLNTLFINEEKLRDAPEYEGLFYLYHEFRHAMQYFHPEEFSPEIQKSLRYVILYNGNCFKLFEDGWRECRLDGAESYFTEAYLSLPYEKDANLFAYRKVREKLGDSPERKELYALWLPGCGFDGADFEKLFAQIDEKCG